MRCAENTPHPHCLRDSVQRHKARLTHVGLPLGRIEHEVDKLLDVTRGSPVCEEIEFTRKRPRTVAGALLLLAGVIFGRLGLWLSAALVWAGALGCGGAALNRKGKD